MAVITENTLRDSGFWNASNEDKKYNISELNTMFNGIILDGVAKGYKNEFKVTRKDATNINIEEGRCWFNDIWLYTDATITFPISKSASANRVDTVIIEINTNYTVREGSIKILKGIEKATNPQPVALIKSGGIYQYAIAYVVVGTSGISNIIMNLGSGNNTYGLEKTPYSSIIKEHNGISTNYGSFVELKATIVDPDENEMIPGILYFIY